MNANYRAPECVIIVLTVQWICNQTCSGRFHSAMNGGVWSPQGKMYGSDWLRRRESSKSHSGVLLLLQRVRVCLHRVFLPSVIRRYSISSSRSHTLLRGINESIESHERETRAGVTLALGSKWVRKSQEMRSEQWSVAVVFWTFIMEILEVNWMMKTFNETT